MKLFNFLSRKQLLKLDKELENFKYDEEIAGLQKLLQDISAEDDTKDKYRYMRLVKAMQEIFIAIRKVYEDE